MPRPSGVTGGQKFYNQKGVNEMAIRRDRESKLITIECDQCGGEELETETDDFDIARQVMKRSGWKAKKDAFGSWQNVCPSCYEEGLCDDFEAMK